VAVGVSGEQRREALIGVTTESGISIETKDDNFVISVLEKFLEIGNLFPFSCLEDEGSPKSIFLSCQFQFENGAAKR
jgi:hypothetical protein